MPLVFDGAYFAASLDKRFFEGKNHYYLSIKVDLPPREIERLLTDTGKVGSREEMEVLRQRALPGLDVRYLEAPPEELPRRTHCNYFEIDHHGPRWRGIEQRQNIAIVCHCRQTRQKCIAGPGRHLAQLSRGEGPRGQESLKGGKMRQHNQTAVALAIGGYCWLWCSPGHWQPRRTNLLIAASVHVMWRIVRALQPPPVQTPHRQRYSIEASQRRRIYQRRRSQRRRPPAPLPRTAVALNISLPQFGSDRPQILH